MVDFEDLRARLRNSGTSKRDYVAGDRVKFERVVFSRAAQINRRNLKLI